MLDFVSVLSHAAVQAFGRLLKDLRERERLSQRQLAAILQVDDSTIARMEVGTRKPPRDAGFYRRLRQVPGFTEADIRALWHSKGAPDWLLADDSPHEEPPVARRCGVASVEGIRIPFDIEAEPGLLTDDELEALREGVTQDIYLFLMAFLRHKQERAKHLAFYIRGRKVEVDVSADLSVQEQEALQRVVELTLADFERHTEGGGTSSQ